MLDSDKSKKGNIADSSIGTENTIVGTTSAKGNPDNINKGFVYAHAIVLTLGMF